MQTIKSCPFCGFDNPVLYGSEETNYHVECPLCGAATKKFENYDKTDDIDDGYDAVALAFKAWSLRKEDRAQ